MMHLVDSVIGFEAGLLDDDGPVAAAESPDAVSSISTCWGPGSEFTSFGELRLVAAIDKIAHDVEIFDVLPGGKLEWRLPRGVPGSRRRRA